MPFHRPIPDWRVVRTMHETQRTHQMEYHNVAGTISTHLNKSSAMNLFTKLTKRMFKPRLIATLYFLSLVLSLLSPVYVAKCKQERKMRILSLLEQWCELCLLVFALSTLFV